MFEPLGNQLQVALNSKIAKPAKTKLQKMIAKYSGRFLFSGHN